MSNKFYYIGLAVILFLGLGTGGVVVYSKLRGIRNNNPLNIRRSNEHWEGLSEAQTDDEFFQFIDAIYGIRAAARNLMTYAKNGIVTLSQIISTWAPPERLVNGVWVKENDTAAYIAAVSSRTGFSPNQVIYQRDYLSLLKAMITQENGINPYSDETIAKGISLA